LEGLKMALLDKLGKAIGDAAGTASEKDKELGAEKKNC
jgi:hypothetical protein